MFVSGSMNDFASSRNQRRSFLQFLQTDLQLVNEIFAGFSSFDFTVIAIETKCRSEVAGLQCGLRLACLAARRPVRIIRTLKSSNRFSRSKRVLHAD